jgi:hypothetical protein
MPQIIIKTSGPGDGHGTEVHRERVHPTDVESDHSSNQLIERISWALSDAADIEHDRRRSYDEPAADSFANKQGTIADTAVF